MDPKDNQGPGTDAPADADKADDQATEAGRVDDNQAPDATQGDQGDSQEVKAEDKAQEKLYAGTFKSSEELEKAYGELRTKATKDAQEKSELYKTLNEVFTPPEPDNVQSNSQGSDNDYDDDDDDSNPLKAEVDRLKRQTTVSNFIMTHQDANPETMNKVLREDPLVSQIGGYEAKLEYAYLKSQGMTKKQAIEEAEKKGAQQVQAKTAEKQAAQVESGQKATPTDENSELWAKARGGTPDERREARRQLIRKGLV